MYFTPAELAAVMRGAGNTWPLEKRVGYINDNIERIAELRAKGYSFDEIADEFNGIVSSDHIRKRFRRWEKEQSE